MDWHKRGAFAFTIFFCKRDFSIITYGAIFSSSRYTILEHTTFWLQLNTTLKKTLFVEILINWKSNGIVIMKMVNSLTMLRRKRPIPKKSLMDLPQNGSLYITRFQCFGLRFSKLSKYQSHSYNTSKQKKHKNQSIFVCILNVNLLLMELVMGSIPHFYESKIWLHQFSWLIHVQEWTASNRFCFDNIARPTCPFSSQSFPHSESLF